MTRPLARSLIAGLFLTTGTLHFLRPELFLKIVPPRLPWPLGLVYLSGFFELVGGAGLLVPRFRLPFQGVLIACLLWSAK